MVHRTCVVRNHEPAANHEPWTLDFAPALTTATPPRPTEETARDVLPSAIHPSARAGRPATVERGATARVALARAWPERGAERAQVYALPGVSLPDARVFSAPPVSSFASTREPSAWIVQAGPPFASSPFIPPDYGTG